MVWTRSRVLAFLFVFMMLLVTAPTRSSPADDAGGCDVELLPGIGPVCSHADGLYEVLADDGSSLGFVHGTDPVPEQEPDIAAARPPACVHDAAEGYYARVVYTWASDRTATQSDDTVRGLVHTANGVVHDEAAALGAVRDLRVLCTPDGAVDVLRVRLPTRLADTTFQTIVQDLQALDALYDTADMRNHYWIYFEDRIACGCGGIGHVGNDASGSVTNGNNGGGARYAVTFGYLSANTMLHERAHNNGAVQNSAPNASGGYHCNDGRDVMCYSDGGSRSDYSHGVCSTNRFDCNNDDYFHTDPAPGTYPSYAWNLGHVHNRYMRGCSEATGILEAAAGLGRLGGPVAEGATAPVPEACRGRPFFLEGWHPQVSTPARTIHAVAYMDLCWYQGDTLLSCHDSMAPRESGVVPQEADAVRIDALGGAQVRYFLRMG